MNVKNKKLLKKINIWIYLVPFLLITIFFSVRSYYSVQQKIAVSYEHFIEDAADAARNYSYTLNKTAEAEKIINGLLDAKLTEAGRTVMLANGVFTRHSQKICKDFECRSDLRIRRFGNDHILKRRQLCRLES